MGGRQLTNFWRRNRRDFPVGAPKAFVYKEGYGASPVTVRDSNQRQGSVLPTELRPQPWNEQLSLKPCKQGLCKIRIQRTVRLERP